ncbi:MAG TPA: glycoside hydrolase family 18 protein [Bacillota bacterium]|nr:glycoside hydrolase family 18 protein [Bacillota bacterium]
MYREVYNQPLSRRGFLTAGALASAAVLLEACSGPEEPYPSTVSPGVQPGITTRPEPTPELGITSVYLPTTYTPAQYAGVAKNLLPAAIGIDRVHLAYAVPAPDGSISMDVPKLPKGASGMLKAEPFKNTELSVAIGGPDTTVAAWSSAFADTARFGRNAGVLIDKLEQLFGRAVHLDLNIGVRAQDPQEITNLVRASRTALENLSSSAVHQLSLVVQPLSKVDQLNTSSDGIIGIVDTFRLAAYDQNGPWSSKSGPIADNPSTTKAILDWSTRLAGKVDKLQFGFPSYGYRFPGAKHEGEDFKRPKDTASLLIPYNQIPQDSIGDDTILLTSSGKIGSDYVSCLSPAVIAEQAAEIRDKYPRIGGWFFWAADGLTADHITATSRA